MADKILVVDDEIDTLNLAKKILEGIGGIAPRDYWTRTSESGIARGFYILRMLSTLPKTLEIRRG